jgi:ERCC4-type nuclease
MEEPNKMENKIVDTREPELLRYKLIELGWNQMSLVSGDFAFLSHDKLKIGITRKTINDLLNSLGNNFSGQLEEMLDCYDINIILLEGSWKPIIEKTYFIDGIEVTAWDSVMNYLHRWFAKGFILELTTSTGHTIHRLNALYALYQKPYSLSASTKRFTDDRILAMPSGCRGKTGIAVLDACGSLKAVSLLEVSELDTIPGVGKKKAELIWNHFNRGKYGNY